MDRLLEGRPPRRRPALPVLAETRSSHQGFRRLLQRHEPRLRSRRQVPVLLLPAVFLPEHRAARSALQLLQHRRHLRPDLEVRRRVALQAAKRRGEGRGRQGQGQGQGQRQGQGETRTRTRRQEGGAGKDEKKDEPPKPVADRSRRHRRARRAAADSVRDLRQPGRPQGQALLRLAGAGGAGRAAATRTVPPTVALHTYDLEKREDKEVLSGIEGYALDAEGKKVLYKAGPVHGDGRGRTRQEGRRRQARPLRPPGAHRPPRGMEADLPRSLAHRARLLLGPGDDGPRLEGPGRALRGPASRGSRTAAT